MRLLCKQCGQARHDTGWTICAACQHKNIEYAKQCDDDAYKIRQEFAAAPPSRMMPAELRRPSEMRGRKSRDSRVIAEMFEMEDEE